MAAVYSEYIDLFAEQGELHRIQELLNESGGGGVFHFETFLWDVMSGKINLNLETMVDFLGDVAFGGVQSGGSQILRILGIALIAAVFSGFSFSLRDGSVADTAFYVAYIVLYGILAFSFLDAYRTAANAIGHITDFMKVMVPSYCIAITLSNGTASAVSWYESILILITIVQSLLMNVVLPLISVHITVNLSGNLSNENRLSKLCEIIELVIGWSLKGIMTLVIGFSGIQSMLGPAIDRVKRMTLVRSAASIPGVGNLIDGISETMLGTGALLKDAFGVGGVIAIFVIGMIPVIRLAVYTFLYKLEAAVIQPVSDRRIVNCINLVSRACGLLMKTVFTAVLLFMVAIALAAYSSL